MNLYDISELGYVKKVTIDAVIQRKYKYGTECINGVNFNAVIYLDDGSTIEYKMINGPEIEKVRVDDTIREQLIAYEKNRNMQSVFDFLDTEGSAILDGKTMQAISPTTEEVLENGTDFIYSNIFCARSYAALTAYFTILDRYFNSKVEDYVQYDPDVIRNNLSRNGVCILTLQYLGNSYHYAVHDRYLAYSKTKSDIEKILRESEHGNA